MAVLDQNVVPKTRHHDRARGIPQILLRIPNVPDLRLEDLPRDLEEGFGSAFEDPANFCFYPRDVMTHDLPREAKIVIVEEAPRVISELYDDSPDHQDVIWPPLTRSHLA